MRFYDDWLTAELPDDEGNDYEDDDRSDEQFDRMDREKELQ